MTPIAKVTTTAVIATIIALPFPPFLPAGAFVYASFCRMLFPLTQVYSYQISKFHQLTYRQESNIFYWAFLILVRSAGVIVLSRRTTCTEATPRINSKAFLISDNAAPSSSVTITWYDFGVDVPVSILFYNYALLNANFY